MNEELIIKLGQDAMRVTAMIAGPMLIATLVIGLIVSVFQALTQINEATLMGVGAIGAVFICHQKIAPSVPAPAKKKKLINTIAKRLFCFGG